MLVANVVSVSSRREASRMSQLARNPFSACLHKKICMESFKLIAHQPMLATHISSAWRLIVSI